MAKVLVTGSLGTIGRPLVQELEKRGHEVWGLDAVHDHRPRYVRADLREFRQLEALFAQRFDYVYHLAAEFGRHNGEGFYENLWLTNVVGTRNVLEWQRRAGFRLIFTSSSEIYGETEVAWLREDLPLQRPLFPHNDYALSKWVNEQQIIQFARRYGCESVRLRLFNAYGPGERYHAYRSVVCLFVYRALMGLPYEVYRGYHRTFTFVDDMIPTLANVADRFHAGEVYNIGGTDYRSVEELSDIVLAATGAGEQLVTYLARDEHNTVSKRPDISKAVRDLGHNPRVRLEQGVPRTVAWMREEYGL
jgi:dTDP-glucose 4,6-dehydratase